MFSLVGLMAGSAVVGLAIALAWSGRLPVTGIGSGGYGTYLWSVIIALYAIGLGFAATGPMVATAVAAGAVGVAATAVLGRSRWVAAAVLGFAALAAALAGLSHLSRWVTGGLVFALVTAAVVLVALPQLRTDHGFEQRLPAAVRNRAGRVLWIAGLAAAIGAAAALPANRSGVVMMVAAIAAGATASLSSRPATAPASGPIVALGALAAGAPVAVVMAAHDQTARWTAATLGAAAVMIAAVAVTVTVVLREIFGPFQAEFDGERAFGDAIRWIWMGAVTDSAATVVVRPGRGVSVDEISLAVDNAPSSAVETKRIGAVVARFRLSGLTAGTRYSLTISAGDDVPAGCTFRTFEPRGDRPIRIAVASCATTASNGRVFADIAAHGPDVFCQIGDLHYENVAASDLEPYREAFDLALSTPALTQLMSRVPVAYVYDDHDFGRNNSDRTSDSIPTVWQNYRQLVPHYELGTADGPVYSRFRVGPVLVVISDTRAERDPPGSGGSGGSGGQGRRIIGPDQERWLLDSPRAARELGCRVMLWCNPTPWLGLDEADHDTWTGFVEQRRRIADALVAAEVEHDVRIIVVSGDAHMIGLDRGIADRDPAGGTSPSDWQARIFPAMNAAALDRRGSQKGAHYGEFEQLGAGQFGIVTIEQKRGTATEVALDVFDQSGHRHGITVPLDPLDPLTELDTSEPLDPSS